MASAVMRPGGRGGRVWTTAALCAMAILGGVLAPGRAAAAPASGAPDVTVTDTTTADFAAGTASGTLTGATGSGDDGEVQLAPALGADFAGDALPAGWTATPWADGGAATVADGAVSVDGARVGTDATYGPGRALEFVATFSDAPFENAGFGVDFGDAPWAMFSTGGGALPVGLYARTSTGGAVQDTPISDVSPTVPHRYRIEWTATGVDYYVDRVKVASHAAAFTSDLRPLASDFAPGSGGVTVDWLRMGPYEANGTFTSRVLDAGQAGAHWQTLDAAADAPDATGVTFETRSGATADPDAAWSDWAAVGAGGAVTSPAGRYLQYRATLTGGTDLVTPTLESVTVSAAANRAPAAGTVTLAPADPTTDATVTATADGFADPDGDAVSLRYRWTVDGQALDGETGPTLDLSKAGNGDRGQTVGVSVIAVDPFGAASDAATDSVTVVDSAPAAGSDAGGTTPPANSGTATPPTPAAGGSAAPPTPSVPAPAAPQPSPSGGVAGATATSPAVRELTAARSVALRTLVRGGLVVRLVAPSGTRSLDVRLYRVVTKRVNGRTVTRPTRILHGAIAVRHGGRLTVRWRPRRADVAKLRSGRYVLRIRAGRDRLHLTGAAAERTLRLTGARVSP